MQVRIAWPHRAHPSPHSIPCHAQPPTTSWSRVPPPLIAAMSPGDAVFDFGQAGSVAATLAIPGVSTGTNATEDRAWWSVLSVGTAGSGLALHEYDGFGLILGRVAMATPVSSSAALLCRARGARRVHGSCAHPAARLIGVLFATWFARCHPRVRTWLFTHSGTGRPGSRSPAAASSGWQCRRLRGALLQPQARHWKARRRGSPGCQRVRCQRRAELARSCGVCSPPARWCCSPRDGRTPRWVVAGALRVFSHPDGIYHSEWCDLARAKVAPRRSSCPCRSSRNLRLPQLRSITYKLAHIHRGGFHRTITSKCRVDPCQMIHQQSIVIPSRLLPSHPSWHFSAQ